MKKLLSLLAVVLTLGLGTAHMNAEAKRIGGGKSLGMQRQATPPAKAPDATPNAAPAAGAAAGAAVAPKRSWMGPVAGGRGSGPGRAGLAPGLLPAFEQGVLEVEVVGYAGTTPYARWDNVPVVGAFLFILMLAIWRRRTV